MKPAALLAALCAAAGLAACGGDSAGGGDALPSLAEVVAAVEGLEGEARAAELLELAREAGGGLSLYTSHTPEIAGALAAGFEEAFDLDVAVYRSNSGGVLQRIREESEAGFAGADVVEAGGLEMVALAGDGLFAGYSSPAAAGLVEGAVHETWTTDSVNTLVLSWNTDLVPEGEVPASWEELADPRWEGEVALDVTDVEWYTTLRDHWVAELGRSEEEADGVFAGIAENARPVRGHTSSAELQAAGEFALFVNYVHVVEGLRDAGAPLAWLPAVEPVVTKTDGTAILRTARNPAAAALFLDWLLDPGQEVLAEHGIAARNDLVVASDLETLLVDLERLAANLDGEQERFDRLFAPE